MPDGHRPHQGLSAEGGSNENGAALCLNMENEDQIFARFAIQP